MISEKLTKQFDGQITLVSNLGEGSEFTFTIKLNCKADIENVKNDKNIAIKEADSMHLFYEW